MFWLGNYWRSIFGVGSYVGMFICNGVLYFYVKFKRMGWLVVVVVGVLGRSVGFLIVVDVWN